MDQDQPQPQGIWLAPALLQLERTPAEKVLLAYICQRAAKSGGLCTDSNNELGQAVGIHQQTISSLLTRLHQANQLQLLVDTGQANKRTLTPDADLLKHYERFAQSLALPSERITQTPKPNTYPSERMTQTPLSESLTPSERIAQSTQVDYPQITHSHPETVKASARPIRHCPITGVEITHQGQLYPRVTEATLKHLFKTDPAQFAAVLKRCGLEVLAGKPMGTQCGMVKMHVDRQAQTDPATHEL